MDISDAGGDQVKVTFTGRLDTPGVDRVETRFSGTLIPSGRSALVDLSHLEFVGSLGVRMFITVARALARKNARLVLFAPQAQVLEVFDNVSLRELIAICADEAEAEAVLKA